MKYPGRFIGALVVGVIAIALIVHLYNYNASKAKTGENMTDNSYSLSQLQSSATDDEAKAKQCCDGAGGNYTAANPLGQNESFSAVNGVKSGADGLPAACSQGNIANPADLLPKHAASEKWAQLNPSGTGSLDGVNLLSAGTLLGVDTVATSLRNANLQVRSEPPNPQVSVGPWNNTTITPELTRRPLEIGCGPL